MYYRYMDANELRNYLDGKKIKFLGNLRFLKRKVKVQFNGLNVVFNHENSNFRDLLENKKEFLVAFRFYRPLRKKEITTENPYDRNGVAKVKCYNVNGYSNKSAKLKGVYIIKNGKLRKIQGEKLNERLR